MPRPPAAPARLPRRAYSVQETADQLGVSRWTVYKMIQDGILAVVKTGPRRRDAIRVPATEIDRFLESRQEDAS